MQRILLLLILFAHIVLAQSAGSVQGSLGFWGLGPTRLYILSGIPPTCTPASSGMPMTPDGVTPFDGVLFTTPAGILTLMHKDCSIVSVGPGPQGPAGPVGATGPQGPVGPGGTGTMSTVGADRAWLRENFCWNVQNQGYLGTHGWAFGGSSTVNHSPAVSNHPCGINALPPNSVGGLAYIYLGSGPEKIIPPLNSMTSGTLVWGFKTPSNITNKNIRVGLRQSIGSDTESGTNLAEARYASSTSGCAVTAADTTWHYLLSDGTVADNAIGPAIAASTYYWLRMKITAGHVSFNLVTDGQQWIQGIEVEVNTSLHAPVIGLTPHFSIQNCDGANADNLGVTFFAFDLPMAGPSQ